MTHRQRTNGFVNALSIACATVILVWSLHAQSAVTRVVVESSGTMGTFGGREYVWATGDMEGTVTRADGTTGRYRVPITLMYPDRDPNGFGFVDVVNSADFHAYTEQTAPFGGRKIYYVGDIIFSDYLRREGYVYLAVQWSRMVTEELGAEYGMIEDGRDGYEIIKDAARFLRDPSVLHSDLSFAPEPVAWTIAFGQSQTGSLLLEFMRRGDNREANDEAIYDGIFAGVHVGCLVLNNDSTPRPPPGPTIPRFSALELCDDPLPSDGKFISLLTESDVAGFQSHLTRHDSPNFRQYEMAGVAHISPEIASLRQMGARRQNPVGFRPVFKAKLHNLAEWIKSDKLPPAPKYLEGAIDPDGSMAYATDADGNVKGGIRLPHMPTELPNGQTVGAPLGVYAGLDPDYDYSNPYPWIGGTFEPFSPEELARRYPGREDYVRRVEGAAAALLADRFILEEDYQAYVAAAQRGW